MFGLGIPELIIIALIILLFFGAKRLPGIGDGLGKTLKEVRNIKKDLNGDRKSAKKREPSEDSASENKGLEGKVVESIQKKLTDKVIERMPGIKQAKQIKDKADKIKKIVS